MWYRVNAADLGEVDPDLQPLGTPFSGNLSVAVPIVGDLLVNVRAVPGAFSPNGDGINDQAAVQYDITNIARPTDVENRGARLGGAAGAEALSRTRQQRAPRSSLGRQK